MMYAEKRLTTGMTTITTITRLASFMVKVDVATEGCDVDRGDMLYRYDV